jgi:hypothetical protein
MADLAHYFMDVPGWFDWPDLYAQLVDTLPSGAHVVEVGGWKGQSAAFMGVEIALSGKAIRFDVVDTWLGTPTETLHTDDPDVRAGRLYEAFLTHTDPVREFVHPVRLASVEAAGSYADGSLDAVFLDADHATASVLSDLEAWWPKVKPGGLVAGHDRDWASVGRAVKAWEAFAGVRVKPASRSSWAFRKPVPVTDWTVPEDERAILIAICSNERSIYRQTAKSLLASLAGGHAEEAVKKHGFQDYAIRWVDQYPSVAAMRDYALMQGTVMGASHVLFLDADMTWPTDLLDKMLRHHSVGMVSGVYHLKQWPYWPVVLDQPFIDPEKHTTEYHYAPQVLDETELQRVDLIGMGCALVPLRITRAFMRPWFEYVLDNCGLPAITEDVAFCARSRAVGCPIWVDPTVKCGHIGQQVIDTPWFRRGELEMRLLKEKRAAGEDVNQMAQLFEATTESQQSGSAA